MPQTPVACTPSNRNGEGPGMPAAQTASPFPSTASSSSHFSRSSRVKRGGSSVARRRIRRVLGNTQKHYAPHVCRFAPYRPPAAVMLDPFPSLRINSLCMAGLSTLVTVHRSGVRLYRERQLTPVGTTATSTVTSSASLQNLALLRSPSASNLSSAAPAPRGVSTASGVFEQLEARSDFQVRESYLCTAMQPVLMDNAVLLSKWSRYFCVASGNDRVVHSVSVMSSGAHFCLHHEKHQTNKVVCMHCTQVATQPFHPAVLKPAVVSVDEVGTLVLFDVEREVPAVLERAPLWFKQSDRRDKDALKSNAQSNDEDGSLPRPPRQTSLLAQHLSPDEEDHVVDAMEKVPVKERATYRFDHGVATRVTLVGPCLELCNHCHNAFMSLSTSRGYVLVSIYVCSRARDVLAEGAQQDGSAEGNVAAELNVVLLRVLWGPRRAFVLEEIQVVQEAAPTDVCEAGVATAARPYQVGLPTTLLLARPALELWQLHACTGERIDTRSLYPAGVACKGSRYGSAPRAASEFVIHWVPLGRHRLTMQNDDRVGPQSWFCIAAVTDDDTVLLLGRAPQQCGTPPVAQAAKLLPSARPPAESASAPLSKVKAKSNAAGTDKAQQFTDANLEGWLDELQPSPTPSPPPEDGKPNKAASPTEAQKLSELPYTVLMKLYSPSSSSPTHDIGSGAAAPSVAAGVVSIMPDLLDNRLILFMADEEALLSVPLPFAERMQTLTDSDPVKDLPEDGSSSGWRFMQDRAPLFSSGATANGTAPPNGPGVDLHGVAEASASNGYSQYLWGATSKAVSAASQGWTSSVQKWAPSSSSYFSFSGAAGPAAGAGADAAASAAPTPNDVNETSHTGAARGQATSPLKAPTALQRTTTAARPTEEPYHSFSIVRPLMAAVFQLTGEDRDSSPSLSTSAPHPVHVSTHGDDAALKREGAGKLHSSSPLALTAVFSESAPSPQMVVPLTEHSLHSVDARSSSEPSTSTTVPTTVSTATHFAVPIRVGYGQRERSGSRTTSSGSRYSGHRRHHHHRRSTASSAVSLYDDDDVASTNGGGDVGTSSTRRRKRRGAPSTFAEGPAVASTIVLPASPAETVEDGAAQATYMEQQMALLTTEEDTSTASAEVGHESASPARRKQSSTRTQEEIQSGLRRLIDVDEPLERNMILYSWKDGHNDLYIRLSVGQDALEQAAAANLAATAAASSPHAHRAATPRAHREPPRITTGTTTDIVDGVHSVGFLSTYHSVVAWRAETASYGNCFNFVDYFRTLEVPLHVLDIQERDKCRLELADLRMQQERDMAAVHPFEMMTVCQNEERTSGEAEWRLHATFPYDDERDGSVVDLKRLNRTADSTRGATAAAHGEWRWATEKEARIWAEEEAQPKSSSKRMRSLVKELKDWSVGPWEYAERWPSTSGGRGGAASTFVWSATEMPTHRCRRRRLSRLRVNVGELRRQSDLTEAHIRELGALREELGL